LQVIMNLNNQLRQAWGPIEPTTLFSNNYSTSIAHHNKNPQFYDEIKVLLPLNLTEKHHLLFKFYHVSCTNARSTSNSLFSSDLSTSVSTTTTNGTDDTLSSISSSSTANRNIETLVGYAWLPIFKNGRLFSGEKTLPLAQNLSHGYLAFEKIGMGQIIGPDNIKWVDGMKPLFRVNLVAQSTVHTVDQHVANFYSQCEKLTGSRSPPLADSTPFLHNPTKRKAPDTPQQQLVPYNFEGEIKINLNNPNKEIARNSFKV
jgi:hypothetical protein